MTRYLTLTGATSSNSDIDNMMNLPVSYMLPEVAVRMRVRSEWRLTGETCCSRDKMKCGRIWPADRPEVSPILAPSCTAGVLRDYLMKRCLADACTSCVVDDWERACWRTENGLTAPSAEYMFGEAGKKMAKSFG